MYVCTCVDIWFQLVQREGVQPPGGGGHGPQDTVQPAHPHNPLQV